MLLWLQKKAEDHQGAVVITGLDCGPLWCLCGYRGSLMYMKVLRMASV